MMRPPIFVTGYARGHTSMTAGIFKRCGAFGGVTGTPNRNNPKGFFENVEIRNNILKDYLRRIGVDRLGQDPLPTADDLRPDPLLRQRVEAVMVGQGYEGGPWFYKGPKLCLVWPVWAKAFPDAKWVIAKRDVEGVIGSCLRTNFMRAYSNREGWRRWVDHHTRQMADMVEQLPHVKVIGTDRILQGDFSQIHPVVEWAGLEWNEQAVQDHVMLKGAA